VFLADTEGMKSSSGLSRRGRICKEREREWVGHGSYLTLISLLCFTKADPGADPEQRRQNEKGHIGCPGNGDHRPRSVSE